MAFYRMAQFLFVILQIPLAMGQPLATLPDSASTPLPVTAAIPLQSVGDEIMSAPSPAKTPATMTPVTLSTVTQSATTTTAFDAKTGSEATATWIASLLPAKELVADHGSNSKWWILNVGGLACELVLGGGYFVTMSVRANWHAILPEYFNLLPEDHLDRGGYFFNAGPSEPYPRPILNLAIAWAAAVQFLPFVASALNLASVSSGLPWLVHHFYMISLVLVSPALSGGAAIYAVPPLGDRYGMGKHIASTPPSFPRARSIFLYMMILLNHFDQYSDSMTCAIALNASWAYAWMMVSILFSGLVLQVATAFYMTDRRKTVSLLAGEPPDAFAAEGRARAANKALTFERTVEILREKEEYAQELLAKIDEADRLERQEMENGWLPPGYKPGYMAHWRGLPTREQIQTQLPAYKKALDKKYREEDATIEYEMKLAERIEAVQGITRLLTENIPQAILSIMFAREVKPSKVVYASVVLSLTLAVKAFVGGTCYFSKNGCNKIPHPTNSESVVE